MVESRGVPDGQSGSRVAPGGGAPPPEFSPLRAVLPLHPQ